jgi:isohexenylglutaconyl-CoA hydratase
VSSLPQLPTLQLRQEGAVLHITLNRPEVRNALSMEMVRDLHTALSAAEGDSQTRVLVLRGAGGYFCAGADLASLASARMKLAGNPNAMAEVNAAFGQLTVDYAGTGLALVAVVEGMCLGGGLGLACVCDVVLAAEDMVMRLPETSLGVVPAQIAPFVAERIGLSQTRRLAVTGAKQNAQEALRLGLVHEVHAASELDAALARVLQQILLCAPGAIAATKKLLRDGRFVPPAAKVQDAAQVFSAAVLGPEGQEGTLAFLQKRKPSWAPPDGA